MLLESETFGTTVVSAQPTAPAKTNHLCTCMTSVGKTHGKVASACHLSHLLAPRHQADDNLQGCQVNRPLQECGRI